MDKDYENFVGRMGSFEDTIDLETDPEELKHSGETFVTDTLKFMGDTILFDF